jgi:hypothetical protein
MCFSMECDIIMHLLQALYLYLDVFQYGVWHHHASTTSPLPLPLPWCVPVWSVTLSCIYCKPFTFTFTLMCSSMECDIIMHLLQALYLYLYLDVFQYGVWHHHASTASPLPLPLPLPWCVPVWSVTSSCIYCKPSSSSKTWNSCRVCCTFMTLTANSVHGVNPVSHWERW